MTIEADLPNKFKEEQVETGLFMENVKDGVRIE